MEKNRNLVVARENGPKALARCRSESSDQYEPSDAERRHARTLWRWVGAERPPFADTPGPGQESVWDFPRPPALRRESREVVLRLGGIEIARSTRAWRLCETASPPTVYLPIADASPGVLEPAGGASFCEWKGPARYWDVVAGEERRRRAAWSYPSAMAPYTALRDCFSVYPAEVECLLDDERVRPQPGGFYGGWVTDDLAGPWKGAGGTGGW